METYFKFHHGFLWSSTRFQRVKDPSALWFPQIFNVLVQHIICWITINHVCLYNSPYKFQNSQLAATRWATIYGWTNLPAFVVLKHNQAVVHQQLVISAKFLPDRIRHFVLKAVLHTLYISIMNLITRSHHETRSREIVLFAIGSWVGVVNSSVNSLLTVLVNFYMFGKRQRNVNWWSVYRVLF